MKADRVGVALAATLAAMSSTPAFGKDPPATQTSPGESAPRHCLQPTQDQQIATVARVIRDCANTLERVEPQSTANRRYYSLAASSAGLVALAGGNSFSPGTTDALAALAIIPIFADDRFNSAAAARVESATANQMNAIVGEIEDAEQTTRLFEQHAQRLAESNTSLYEQITVARTHLASVQSAPLPREAAALERHTKRLTALNGVIAAASQIAAASEETQALLNARRMRFEALTVPTAISYYDAAHAARVRALSAIEPSPSQSLTSIIAAPFLSLTGVFRTRGSLAQDAFASPVAVDVAAIRTDLPELRVADVDVNIPTLTITHADLDTADFEVVDRLAAAARATIAQLRAAEANVE